MSFFTLTKVWIISAVTSVLMIHPYAAFAAPGAHGPNGEHLDNKASTAASTAQNPRVQAQSDTYELVGTLFKDELSMFIDRYDTNAPVRKAVVHMELGNLKATAKYHNDAGDFSIDDQNMLKALWKQGTHALIFSIIEESDSDLIDAKLVVGSSSIPDGHSHFPFKTLGIGLLVAVVFVVVWRKYKSSTSFRQGGLS